MKFPFVFEIPFFLISFFKIIQLENFEKGNSNGMFESLFTSITLYIYTSYTVSNF